jgi:DNA ligase-associated metallophosphoesterase
VRALHHRPLTFPGPAIRGLPQSAFSVGGLEAVPHHSGALYLPSERALLLSDLHLEKASSYAARGVFLPPYDTRATLGSVAVAIAAFEPRQVISMGDSFHDRTGPLRLEPDDAATLRRLQGGRAWLWLTGNHDPDAPSGLDGEVADTIALGGVMLRHEPSHRGAEPEIAGHLHPAARIRLRGRGVRRRCFISDGNRLVMPAMGSYAGGLNVRDGAIQRLFDDGADVWMLGDARVFQVSRALLMPD